MAGLLPTARGEAAYDNAKARRKGRLAKLFVIYKRKYPILRLCSPTSLLAVFGIFCFVYVVTGHTSVGEAYRNSKHGIAINERILRARNGSALLKGQPLEKKFIEKIEGTSPKVEEVNAGGHDSALTSDPVEKKAKKESAVNGEKVIRGDRENYEDDESDAKVNAEGGSTLGLTDPFGDDVGEIDKDGQDIIVQVDEGKKSEKNRGKAKSVDNSPEGETGSMKEKANKQSVEGGDSTDGGDADAGVGAEETEEFKSIDESESKVSVSNVRQEEGVGGDRQEKGGKGADEHGSNKKRQRHLIGGSDSDEADSADGEVLREGETGDGSDVEAEVRQREAKSDGRKIGGHLNLPRRDEHSLEARKQFGDVQNAGNVSLGDGKGIHHLRDPQTVEHRKIVPRTHWERLEARKGHNVLNVLDKLQVKDMLKNHSRKVEGKGAGSEGHHETDRLVHSDASDSLLQGGIDGAVKKDSPHVNAVNLEGMEGLDVNVEGLADEKDRTVHDPRLSKDRQQAVVSAFRHAWNGYKSYAMGFDELKPVSRSGANNLGGLGATIIDALDTALIMGQGEIVEEAGKWVQNELQYHIANAGQVNLFETTIRILGGLLSAFYLSGGRPTGMVGGWEHRWGPLPEVYLQRAQDLGDRLLEAFKQSKTAIPLSDVVLSSRSARSAGFNGGASSTAECTTVQLEFLALSRETNNSQYGEAAMRTMEHVRRLPKFRGLVPIFIDPNSGEFYGQEIRLGSRGDSYYEYLLKVWLQQGRSPSFLRTLYDEAMEGVKARLVARSVPKGLLFIGELPSGGEGHFHPKMDHLVCFLGGTLALGVTGGLSLKQAEMKQPLSKEARDTLELAKDLTHTCFEMYNVTATGLAPEIAYFSTHMESNSDHGTRPDAEYRQDIDIHPLDRHNLLRPETVESLFYLYRITGDKMYRDWGWQIFEAFENYSRVESGGYSSLNDVTRVPPPMRDSMETFFLGETLKYLYLLFDDNNLLPLDKFVFNTEAHPFPIFAKE